MIFRLIFFNNLYFIKLFCMDKIVKKVLLSLFWWSGHLYRIFPSKKWDYEIKPFRLFLSIIRLISLFGTFSWTRSQFIKLILRGIGESVMPWQYWFHSNELICVLDLWLPFLFQHISYIPLIIENPKILKNLFLEIKKKYFLKICQVITASLLY